MLLQAYHDWAADSVLDVRIQLEQCLQSASAPAKLAVKGKSPLHAKDCWLLMGILLAASFVRFQDPVLGTSAADCRYSRDEIQSITVSRPHDYKNIEFMYVTAFPGAGQARKTSLALESVLVSILHSSVMDSLAEAHASPDEALYNQTQEHHEAGSQVVALSPGSLYTSCSNCW